MAASTLPVFAFTAMALSPLTAAETPADAAWARITGNTMSWTSSPALDFPEIAEPDSRHIAYKDPSIIRAKNSWHIFASEARHSANDGTRYSLAYLGFSGWENTSTSKVVRLLAQEKLACAPQALYFTPKRQWYLIYVWENKNASYFGPAFSTLQDIDRPETLSPPQACFPKIPDSLPVTKRWIDFHVIADSRRAYLFFTNDKGNFLRSHTSLEAFPLGWSDPVVLLTAPVSVIFEGSQTYKIKGRPEYFTMIEAIGPGGRRFFNSYVADALDGEWRATGSIYEHPFAGCDNVKFPAGSAPWSVNISHGELVRAANDETMLLDPEHLQFIYQGWDRKARIPGIPLGKFSGYHETPWKLGLLRAD